MFTPKVTEALSAVFTSASWIYHSTQVCVSVHGIRCDSAGGSVLTGARDVRRMNGRREMRRGGVDDRIKLQLGWEH